MKLPSIQYLIVQAKSSLLRFPLTIVASFIAVILGIYLVEFGKDIDNIFPYINIMLALAIGIPLYFCMTIIANKRKFDQKKIVYSNLMATLVLVAIYFTLPNAESTHNTTLPYIKYGLYNMTCHLLVAVVPFAFNKQHNGFWHYNKILFLRILLSVLYSAFIFVGLIIALTALKLLFDVKIHEQLYFEIWIATIGLFNTWFFVSGIPTDFDHLEDINDYPKGLRVFSQYVLLPLLGLYLVILYAYGIKILITSNWPKGIVAYLIIFVSILGILAFLLLHPYGNLKESAWIKKASKGYYFVLIPLLVLLYIAIFMRINDYGITINRYAVLMLALWITIVCVYTVFGKTNIKFIPTSLAIITILISFGPWGMFSVSERSQVDRLRTILQESKILKNGKIQNEAIWVQDSLPKFYATNEHQNEGKMQDTLHNEVQSIVKYLDDHHGFSAIQSWYKQDINALIDLQKKQDNDKDYYYNDEAAIYIRSMGLKNEWFVIKKDILMDNFSVKETNGYTMTSGYDYLINFNYYENKEQLKIKNFTIDTIEYELSFADSSKKQLILKNKKDTLQFQLDRCIQKLKNEYGNGYKSDIPASSMTIIEENTKLEIKLEFHNIDTESKKGGYDLKALSGNIFIKKK